MKPTQIFWGLAYLCSLIAGNGRPRAVATADLAKQDVLQRWPEIDMQEQQNQDGSGDNSGQ